MENDTFTARQFLGFFELRAFVVHQLPVLNDLIDKRKSCPINFARKINTLLASLLPETEKMLHPANEFRMKWAMHLLTLMGFATASIERHFQTFRIPMTVWQMLPIEVEDLMVRLGEILHMPPRDSSYTTWLHNNGRYSFDKSPAWKLFHKGVIVYNNCCKTNNDLLRPICKGLVSIDHVETRKNFEKATKNIKEVFEVWRTFMEKDANGLPNLSPEYFTFYFRTFFPTYLIGGKEYTGSNAANIASGISFDLLSGGYNIYYAQTIIPERMVHFTLEDIAQIKSDQDLPNVLNWYLEALGVSEGMLEHMSTEDLSKVGSYASSALRESFDAYYNMMDSWGGLFSMHFGMINNYLTKTIKKYEGGCPLGYNLPAVDPEKGTGHMDHSTTKSLADMRRNNKSIRQIKNIIG